jgi:hypothetical protein
MSVRFDFEFHQNIQKSIKIKVVGAQFGAQIQANLLIFQI